MNTRPDPEWQEPLHRGRLDPETVARLRQELSARPGELQQLEEELVLEDALGRLPRAVAPSNFTAQVLQSIERGERGGERRSSGFASWWRRYGWARQTAAATIVAVSAVGFWQVRVQQRVQLARTVAEVARTADAGDLAVESWKDFDAIQLLRESPRPDDVELLTALSQQP